MNAHLTRLLPVTAALALVLSACGSESPGSADGTIEPPGSQIDSGGLRAPTPIRTTGGGSAVGQGEAALATDAATSDMMIAPAYLITEFVAGAGLGALPTNSTGYVFDAGAMPTADDAARVAAALGVAGDPVLVDDGYSVMFRVGPVDGSAPSVTVWDDAMLSWNYSSAWADEPAFGCAVAGSAVIEPESVDAVTVDPEGVDGDQTMPVDPDDEVVDEPVEPVRPDLECVEPEPPTGVPTAAEAESRANEYLAGLGVDVSTVTLETWADEWSAQVSATETIDGVVARSWGFGFGGDAVLRHAWGSLASPEPVGPYDLIDLGTAIERLNDGRYGWGYGGGIAVMESDVAMGAIAEAPPEGGDVEMPGAEIPEPEEITVTLTDVDADLWWVWDVDGSAWLLPAYRFTGDDGGQYTVPAVTDEYLIEVEPPVEPRPEPAPMPVEPGAEPMPAPDMYLPGFDDPALTDQLGLTVDEFTAFVQDEFGWGPVRVAWADGEAFALTEDLVFGRVNVAVETDADGNQYVIAARVEFGADGPAPEPIDGIVSIVEVHEGVAYYPACGNETLQFQGAVWYQLTPWSGDEVGERVADLLDEISRVEREAHPVASGLARVVAPGPGDDVGTLVIWADGVARWISDSGDLDVWLTDIRLEYPWVC